jgi:hypothetical protein
MFLSAQLDTLYFLSYLGPLTLPFIYLVSIPHLLTRLKSICLRKQRRFIAPVTLTIQKERPVLSHRTPAVVTSRV